VALNSYKISDDLHLVKSAVERKVAAKPVEVPTNHIVIIDCSGSMYGDLPKVREQLKKKIPKVLKETDTLSVIWFSGRDQFGTLLEAEPVSTLTDLTTVNAAIDRWVRPQGLTGFKQPLEEALKVVERLKAKFAGHATSLFFMSDGCDNQWGKADILKAVEKVGASVSAATFVEYGYYADRPLLTQMAEKSGGTLIFSEHFDKYAPIFESAISKKVSGAPRIEVTVEGDPIGGFAFTFDDQDLLTFAVEDGKVRVPADTEAVYFLAPKPVGTKGVELVTIAKGASEGSSDPLLKSAYAAVSLFSTRMSSNVVFSLLKALGDVDYIEKFSGCFGKQKYSEFQESSKLAAFDSKLRFLKGFDPNKVPREDAFTVLELLRILADDEARVLLDHPEFSYTKIGRSRLDASDQLTSDEIDEVKQLSEQIANERDAKKLTELTQKLSALTAAKQPALKFVADPVGDQGYPISTLTLNEERPNISILVKKLGTVDISARLTDELKDTLPASFPTYIHRNYTIVKDGLINVKRLPVLVSDTVLARLRTEGLVGAEPPTKQGDRTLVVVDLGSLPVINRKMVKATSAKVLFEREYELAKLRASQKVFNTIKKEQFPRKSEGFEAVYSIEAAAWLKEQGLTDFGGFSPKSVAAEATDFYMGKELKVSLKGLSSLPSLKDVKEKIAKNKLTASASLMVPAVNEVEAYLVSDDYKQAKDGPTAFEAWLTMKAAETTKAVRSLIFEMAQTKFSVIVGQVWFSEFASLEENSMTVTVDGEKVEGKVDMREIEIKI
jgi:hypothetical protein